MFETAVKSSALKPKVETISEESLEAKAKPRGHSTARQAARIAEMAGAGKLVIGHYSKTVENPAVLVAEASEEFKNVIAANEGLVLNL